VPAVGVITFELRLEDSHSLKDKRHYVKGLKDRLRARFNVSVAEIDGLDSWLNLQPDAYWSSEGRLSIDAVILFGGVLAMGAWGAPFFRGLSRMWSKRALFREGLGRGVRSSMRHARLLRPRKVRRPPPSIAP